MEMKEREAPSSPKGSARTWCWFLLLWVVGALLRTVYLVDVMDAPDVVSPILDSNWHRTQALRIAGGQWFPDVPFWRAPAYQYFLAPLFFLSKGDPLIPRVAQVILSGAVCGLIYLVGRRVFGHAVGLLAGFLACGYQMYVYFSAELLATTLEVFANALLLLAVLRAEERGTGRGWLAAGVLLGFSAIVRPNILIFAPLLFFFARGAGSWRRGWERPLALTVGALVLILPVTGINLIKGRDRVPIAYQGGVNFYIGNSPYADGKTVFVPGTYEQEYSHRLGEYRCQVQMVSEVLAERDRGRDMKPSEQDRYWYGKAFRYIASDPGHFAVLLLRKLYYFWNTYEVSNNRNIELFLREHSPWLRPPFPWFGLVAPLGLVGAVVSWRRGRGARLLVLFLAAQIISVILFFVCARYRMSAVIVLLILAAFAVVWLVQRFRESRWFKAGLASLVLVPLFWFSHTGYLRVQEVTDEAIHQFNQALAFTREGRFEEAVELMRLVHRLNPLDPMVNVALGNTLLRMDRFEEAKEAFDGALSLRPSLGAIVHSDLGTYLAQHGRASEAEKEYHAALAVDPGFILARMNLGGLLSNSGRPEEALPHFEEVLRRAPDQADRVLTEIAITLDRLGRWEEAVDAVRQALEKNHTNARAHALLAGFLEQAGDLEGARREWALARDWAADNAERVRAEDRLKALE